MPLYVHQNPGQAWTEDKSKSIAHTKHCKTVGTSIYQLMAQVTILVYLGLTTNSQKHNHIHPQGSNHADQLAGGVEVNCTMVQGGVRMPKNVHLVPITEP